MGSVAALGAFFSFGVLLPRWRDLVSRWRELSLARSMWAVLVLSDRLCLKVGRMNMLLLPSSLPCFSLVMVLLDPDRVRLSFSLTPPHRGARNPDVDDPAVLWLLGHVTLRGEVGEVAELTLTMLPRLPGLGELAPGALQSRANWRSYSAVSWALAPRYPGGGALLARSFMEPSMKRL